MYLWFTGPLEAVHSKLRKFRCVFFCVTVYSVHACESMHFHRFASFTLRRYGTSVHVPEYKPAVLHCAIMHLLDDSPKSMFFHHIRVEE
jgi:hypothetical protein